MRNCFAVLLLTILTINPVLAEGEGDAVSEQPALLALDKASALLSKASNGAITAEQVFEGPDGLTGVVMQSPDGKGIAWMPISGKTFFIGLLMDESGMNLSQHAHDRYIGAADPKPVPQTAAPVGRELIKALDSLKAVTLGHEKAHKTVYIFADLKCHYCQELWRTDSATQHPDVKIKWIPVGAMGNESMAQAASLLAADADEQVALLEGHHGAMGQRIAAMQASDPRYSSLVKDLEKNTNLFSKLGQGTPILLYWNGKDVEKIIGMPDAQQYQELLRKVKPDAQHHSQR